MLYYALSISSVGSNTALIKLDLKKIDYGQLGLHPSLQKQHYY